MCALYVIKSCFDFDRWRSVRYGGEMAAPITADAGNQDDKEDQEELFFMISNS